MPDSNNIDTDNFREAGALGYGVPRSRSVKPKAEASLTPLNGAAPEVVSLDHVTWIDKPTKPDQILDPKAFRVKRVHTEIFDLSNPDQLRRYSELQTSTTLRTGNEFIASEERAFSEKIDNWRVMVTIRTVEYRDFLPRK